MTGASATGAAEVGAKFSAWDGYIYGKNINLVPNRKIVQLWRTTEFKETDEDSILETELKVSSGDSCDLTLKHSNIPGNQPDYKQGWIDYYFKPMQEYFKPYEK